MSVGRAIINGLERRRDARGETKCVPADISKSRFKSSQKNAMPIWQQPINPNQTSNPGYTGDATIDLSRKYISTEERARHRESIEIRASKGRDVSRHRRRHHHHEHGTTEVVAHHHRIVLTDTTVQS